MLPRFPLADLLLIIAFIVLAILGYVALFGIVGGSVIAAFQHAPLPSQYP
jgi:hypothetical protein